MSFEKTMHDFIMKQLHTSPLVMWLVDNYRNILFVSGDTEKALKATKEEVQNTCITYWLDHSSLEKVDALLSTAAEGEMVETELNLCNKINEPKSYYVLVKVISPDQFLYCFMPIPAEYFQMTEQLLELNSDFSNLYSEMYRKNKVIEQQKEDYYLLSVTDSLTRLFNRRYFYDVVEDEIQVSEKENTPLSFLMIDINEFKKVNDRYGHHTGDKLLISIAELMLDNLQEGEKAFRFGGDEFLIVLHRSRKYSIKWASNISNIFKGYSSIASLSYGAVEYNGNAEDIPVLLNEADKYMYEQKRWLKEKNQEGRGNS